MKNNILYALILLTAFCIADLNAQNRDALWLNGIGATSASWDNAKTAATQTEGYNLNNISTFSYAPHQNSVASSATQMNSEISVYNNVLGIGHDGGGIILRQMAKDPQSKLSAIILDGVPNQGSKTLKKMLPENGVNQMTAFINEINAFKTGAQSCQACQAITAFSDWVNSVNAFEERYREYTPESPVMSNLGTPSIPYAVIWGNEDEPDGLILTRLLGSRANLVIDGKDNGYLECFRDEINDRLQDLNNQTVAAQATAVLGTASAINKLQSAVTIEDGGIKIDVTKLAESYIGVLTAIQNYITAIKKIDLQLGELLECELVHQALNLRWNLLVSGEFTAVPVEVQVPNAVCCDECYSETDPQIQGYCFSVCFDGPPVPNSPGFCYQYNPQTVYYAVQTPHDGLLTRDEQQLAGAVNTYEAKKTNHFQEQFWFNSANYGFNTSVRSALMDMFNGNIGTPFFVPK